MSVFPFFYSQGVNTEVCEQLAVFLAVKVFPYQQAHEPLAISFLNTLCSRLPQRRCWGHFQKINQRLTITSYPLKRYIYYVLLSLWHFNKKQKPILQTFLVRKLSKRRIHQQWVLWGVANTSEQFIHLWERGIQLSWAVYSQGINFATNE